MALAIETPTARSEDVWGRHKVRIVTVTFDSSYDAGGESFTPADVGLAEFTAVLFAPDASGPYVFTYDYTDQLILVQGVEQDADAATTEPLDEEDDTADLDAVSVRVICIGI